MKFDTIYTSKTKKAKDPTKEALKIELSDDSFALAEALHELNKTLKRRGFTNGNFM